VQLKIRLKQNSKYLTISITDKGIGIPVKDQKKVFNKFHRIYSKKSPSVKGTGLGLYWVNEIIKYHGGKVTVSSEGHDCGTTFIIELPIYQASKKRYINRLLEITRRRKLNREGYDEES
jgi:signal transduction histidine kinase